MTDLTLPLSKGPLEGVWASLKGPYLLAWDPVPVGRESDAVGRDQDSSEDEVLG